MIQGALRNGLLVMLLLGISVSARAGIMAYDFSYELQSGEVLSGMLSGELQSDLDTVLVSSIEMVAFSEFPGIEFVTDPFVNVASLSGAGIAFGTSFAGPTNEFTFALTAFSTTFPDGAVLVFGPAGEPITLEPVFIPQNWSLTAKNPAPAPLPSTLLLLGLAVAGLSRYRHNAKASSILA